ncbi:MAG: hypothetical protein HYX38_10095 [Rhodospirillales bacterium]|nr:hypothetical protein [Rhodospirillales bacterium]
MFNYLFHPYLRWLRDRSESDRPDFDIDRNGSPSQTLVQPPVNFPTPESNLLSESAPPTGLMVEQPNEVPGFRVGLSAEVPGFNLNENDLPHPETTWPDRLETPLPAPSDTAQTLALPPGVEEPNPPTPQLPDWLRNVLAMPVPQLSTAFDPQTGRRIVPYEALVNWTRPYPSVDENMRGAGAAGAYAPEIAAMLGRSSLEAPAIKQWAPSVPPARLADIDAHADSPPSTVPEARWNSWPQPSGHPSAGTQATGVDAEDPQRTVVQALQQQTPFPQEQQTQLVNFPATTFGKDAAGVQPRPLIGSSPIEHSVYSPDIDPGYGDLFDPAGVGDNRTKGNAARDAEAAKIMDADPNVPFVKERRIYAKDIPGHMVADIMYLPNGTSEILILEVKSGDATLSQRQLVTLVEAVRTGQVYLVNEEAAKKFGLRPYETFASKGIIPFVYVSGGNRDAIIRQLNKLGIDAVPEKTRRGQVPRLRLRVRPT